ncbi:hypothetical protein NMY22_g3939 [Coprinellus aureogranulatus]|nr:hypothetical protein NMY22_g3939 [Coprinellus aureogranulatus]
MEQFPEEPLNLSAADGFGYFPGDLNQTLNGRRYRIIRKLGWGPRSSTWLVSPEPNKYGSYWAAQIFTAAASKDKNVRRRPAIRNRICGIPGYSSFSFTNFVTHFWEKSVHGDHLVMVAEPYGMTVWDLLQQANTDGQQGLPMHVVQKVVSVVISPLSTMHEADIMNGGLRPENVVFTPLTGKEWLEANPPSASTTVEGLPVVLSQPPDHYKPKWHDHVRDIAMWMLHFNGYGHSQSAPYKPEVGYDYSSAPETLLQNPICGIETDIWMLGCLIFQLLTGRELINSTASAAERLGEIRDVLHGRFPDAWMNDENISSLPPVNPSRRTLRQMLQNVLTPDEASSFSELLTKCLAIDPKKRISAEELFDHPWVEEGGKYQWKEERRPPLGTIVVENRPAIADRPSTVPAAHRTIRNTSSNRQIGAPIAKGGCTDRVLIPGALGSSITPEREEDIMSDG